MFLIVTHVWALIWWFLMPTWPLGTTYTKGLLDTDQRKIVEEKLVAGQRRASAWMKRHRNVELRRDPGQRGSDEGRPDNRPPALRRQLRRLPRARREGRRQLSRPDGRRLALGRRAGEDRRDDARRHQLPPCRTAGSRRCRPSGATRCWTATQVTNVAAYVHSLSNPVDSTPQNVDTIEAGREVFLTTCAACHGEDAKGNREVGAPNLTDQYWIYGGDLRPSSPRSMADARATCRPGTSG